MDSPRRFAFGVLAAGAAAFAAPGLSFVVAPGWSASLAGIELAGPLARNDLRAVFGALVDGWPGPLGAVLVAVELALLGLVAFAWRPGRLRRLPAGRARSP